MHGFITESVSKIYDGFGTAGYLLMVTFGTRLIYLPIEKLLGKTGIFVYVLLLLALGTYMIGRSLMSGRDKNRAVFDGMTAGVLFWQVVQFSELTLESEKFNLFGWLVWFGLLIVVGTLWKKILPTGLGYFLLEWLWLWGGFLYLRTDAYIIDWPSLLIAGYRSIRAVALVAILFLIWWIAFKTQKITQRQTCGIFLAFCAMLAGLWF
jgi:hypothetical protein